MDDKAKQSMGELAALMYEDPDFKVPEGMTLKQAMDQYTEQRFPGTQARIAANRVKAETVAEVRKEREAFQQDIAKEKAARAREAAIARIQADPHLRITAEEIPEVEKVMAERFIGTYEDAASIYRGKIKPFEVAAPRRSSQSMDMPGMTTSAGDEFAWLRPAWANRDGSVLDKVTRSRVSEILNDYDRDPVAADKKWNG